MPDFGKSTPAHAGVEGLAGVWSLPGTAHTIWKIPHGTPDGEINGCNALVDFQMNTQGELTKVSNLI